MIYTIIALIVVAALIAAAALALRKTSTTHVATAAPVTIAPRLPVPAPLVPEVVAKVDPTPAAPVRPESALIDKMLGRTAETDAILDAAVANQPKGDTGRRTGTSFDFYGDWRDNDFVAGVALEFDITVFAEGRGAAKGFEFKVFDESGTPSGDTTVSIRLTGPNGETVTATGNPKETIARVTEAAAGSKWKASVVLSRSGPAKAQTNAA